MCIPVRVCVRVHACAYVFCACMMLRLFFSATCQDVPSLGRERVCVCVCAHVVCVHVHVCVCLCACVCIVCASFVCVAALWSSRCSNF